MLIISMNAGEGGGYVIELDLSSVVHVACVLIDLNSIVYVVCNTSNIL